MLMVTKCREVGLLADCQTERCYFALHDAHSCHRVDGVVLDGEDAAVMAPSVCEAHRRLR